MKVMKKQYIAPLMETDYMDVAEDIIAVSLPLGTDELQQDEILVREDDNALWGETDF